MNRLVTGIPRHRPSLSRLVITLSAGILAALASTAPLAQEAIDEASLYVELLVFTPTAPAWNHVETTTVDPGDPRLLNAVSLTDEADTAYSSLSRGNLALEGSRNSLERTGEYEVLLHEGWVQPAIRAIHAPWVRLQSHFATGPDGPLVDGRIRVGTLDRFFQVRLDLAFSPEGLELETGDQPVSAYHLRVDRRVSADQIYYVDHPRFGALLLVREEGDDD